MGKFFSKRGKKWNIETNERVRGRKKREKGKKKREEGKKKQVILEDDAL